MKHMASVIFLAVLAWGVDDARPQNYGQIPAPAQSQPIL